MIKVTGLCGPFHKDGSEQRRDLKTPFSKLVLLPETALIDEETLLVNMSLKEWLKILKG